MVDENEREQSPPGGNSSAAGMWEETPEVEALEEYRPVCPFAIAALVVGLLSPIALFHWSLAFVPLLALVLGGVALWRIGRSELLVGRRAALVGMTLSAFFLFAAPVHRAAFDYLLDLEARAFARQWLQYIQNGAFLQAHQLTVPPYERLGTSKDIWHSYLVDEQAQKGVEEMVNVPGVLELAVLGSRAQVRYYDTEGIWREVYQYYVKQNYAVTYEEDGEKKTFFLTLYLVRTYMTNRKQAGWYLEDVEGGVIPRSYTGPVQGVTQ